MFHGRSTLSATGDGQADIEANLRGTEPGIGSPFAEVPFVPEEGRSRYAIADRVSGAWFNDDLSGSVNEGPVRSLIIRYVVLSSEIATDLGIEGEFHVVLQVQSEDLQRHSPSEIGCLDLDLV